MVRKLEIPAFAANFGADKQACAVLFGEVSGIAIALEQGEALVEDCGGDFDFLLQTVHDFCGCIRGLADDEHFLLFEFFEESDEPADFCCGFIRLWRQLGKVGLTLWEARECGAGVAEDNSTSSVFIEQ